MTEFFYKFQPYYALSFFNIETRLDNFFQYARNFNSRGYNVSLQDSKLIHIIIIPSYPMYGATTEHRPPLTIDFYHRRK